MKKVIALLLLTGACSAYANNGSIAFNGNILVPSCTVAGGGNATGTGNGIELDFGVLPIGELNDGSTWNASGKTFHLLVTCPGNMTGFTSARATLNAAGGSGLDPNNSRLLGLTTDSVASGVAVAVWQGTTQQLDLSSNPVVSAPFVTAGSVATATIELGTLFARTSAAANPGVAKATLPVTLTYD